MDDVGLVRGRLRPGRRAVGTGLPRLRQGRPIRRRRVPLLRAAGPVADADDAAHVGADVHADDAVADQRAFHSSAVSRTFVQADATALFSADFRAICTTDAAAQSPANAEA